MGVLDVFDGVFAGKLVMAAPLIHGDYSRFLNPQETCDVRAYLAPKCPYMPLQIPFFLQICKKGKIAETILPMITRKHNLAKNGYGGDRLKNL